MPPISSSLSSSSSSSSRLSHHITLAIRRETKGRWERRAPLTPQHVNHLIKNHNVKVLVQPSTRRAFPDDRYAEAGAVISEDLGSADVVMGIKEVQPQDMMAGKTYFYFSHTHKGQPHNMGSLKTILEKKIRLVDYELITNDEKKRLVLFGRFAGFAGMTDGLHGLGSKMLGLGYSTSFLHIGMSHTHPSVSAAKHAIAQAGEAIRRDGIPKQLGPVTFVFTGSGNVSGGAQEMFRELPHEYVDARDLEKIVRDSNPRLDRVYAAQVKSADYVVLKDGQACPKDPLAVRDDYYAHPEKYRSEFHTKIAPYATMLITGAYWDDRYPRLITTEQLRDLQASGIENRGRMLTVADISCDIKGGLEFMSHATTIDDPFFYVDAVRGVEHKNVEEPGVQILAVDNLPTEFPMEASNHFSESLLPFVKELASGNAQHPVIARATIAENGKLAPAYAHLKDAVEKAKVPKLQTSSTSPRATKKVLLLGSGMVAGPLVEYLLRLEDVHVIIASNVLQEAKALAGGRARTEVADLDVGNSELMSRLVSNADVVLSLVPAPLHPIVAKACIQNRKHMVTASYISPAMRELDASAKDAGVAIMNEIGLDPGIDHLTAMSTIDEVTKAGGKVKSFVSWCGGLPAPECSDSPLGYKFSWSPRGVLTAGLNPSRFKMANRVIEVPGPRLMPSYFPDVSLGYSGFAFEGIPNRDALPYADMYGLGTLENMDTMFRGTLRYKGYAELMYCFNKTGFLNTEAMQNFEFQGWTHFLDTLLAPGHRLTDEDRLNRIREKTNLASGSTALGRFEESLRWFGLLPNGDGGTPPPINTPKTPLDLFCALLSQRLRYLPGERDMVALRHEFGIEGKDGRREVRTSTLVTYGSSDKHTAMAKTVGYPAAMAAELLLRGEILERGVLAPVYPHVYKGILERLELEGIKVVEKRGRYEGGWRKGGLEYRDAGW